MITLLYVLALVVLLPQSMTATTTVATPVITADGTSYSGGSGTQTDPYLITTKQDVVALATAVEQGNSYAGMYFKMTGDIDLALEKGSEEAKNYHPIGNNIDGDLHPFSGTFDGNNHKILNLNVSWEDIGFVGFFGVGQNATIKNLTIAHSEIYGDLSVAAILGVGMQDCVVENCHTTADVKIGNRKFYVAGICGGFLIGGANGSVITDCTNRAEVNGCVGYTAGILATNGQNNTRVVRCGNMGNITDDNLHVAGIVAHSKNGITVEDCFNTGKISLLALEGAENALAAGILASGDEVPAEEDIFITRCYNAGVFNEEVPEEGAPKTHVIYDLSKCLNDNATLQETYYCAERYELDYQDAEPLSANVMKSADFVSILNGGKADGCWQIVEGVNEGFPVSTAVVKDPSSIHSVEQTTGVITYRAGIVTVAGIEAAVWVNVYDVAGNQLLAVQADAQGNAAVDVNALPAGIYVVKAADKNLKIAR